MNLSVTAVTSPLIREMSCTLAPAERKGAACRPHPTALRADDSPVRGNVAEQQKGAAQQRRNSN